MRFILEKPLAGPLGGPAFRGSAAKPRFFWFLLSLGMADQALKRLILEKPFAGHIGGPHFAALPRNHAFFSSCSL